MHSSCISCVPLTNVFVTVDQTLVYQDKERVLNLDCRDAPYESSSACLFINYVAYYMKLYVVMCHHAYVCTY